MSPSLHSGIAPVARALVGGVIVLAVLVVAGPQPAVVGTEFDAVGSADRPGADNTGVPHWTALRQHDGDLNVTLPGTVIDGLDIHGYVRVRAANVTIRNSIVRGGAAGGQDALVKVTDDAASLTIHDSELVAAHPNPDVDGLRGWNITATRLNIHDVIDGGHFWGKNVTVQDSWIHDTLHYANDPNHPDGSHDDGIQIQQGSNIHILRNTIEDPLNAAIMITQDMGATSDVHISGNYLNDGECAINISEKGRGPLRGMTITDNKFGRDVHNPDGDACAVVYDRTSPITLENNVYADTQEPAKIQRR